MKQENRIACSLCASGTAQMYCVNDDAYLCNDCDAKYHSNPLAARHERRPLTAFEASSGSGIFGSGPSEDVAVVPQFEDNATADMNAGIDIFDDIFGSLDVPEGDQLQLPGINSFELTDNVDDPFGLNDIDCVVPCLYENQQAARVPEDGALIFSSRATTTDAPNGMVPVMVPQTVLGNAVPDVTDCDAVDGTDETPDVQEESTGDDYDYEESEEQYEDPNDDDFYVAPRRVHGVRRSKRSLPVATVGAVLSEEPELTREERVARYRAKRARRSFQKTIRYESRKAYAEIRPRIKGRFVSHEEYAEYKAQQEQQEAVVPAC